MLKLTNIKKNYVTGDSTVQALKGVSIEFRESEFVSILGQSGCGKTTLLNIIGGLDQYTDGDLIINSKSTKQFKSRDWDTYRNHSIGFIFQSYNLIPHQSVLSNVELALTLSGVSAKERRARAKEALIKVGLGDQLKKKPNQMSGGQMQRVAIARALVNNPEILLADEPTGALDSETSVQIMELIKEIAKDRLVIMVTHNPELAEQYSTRIINLLDGNVISDSNPYSSEDEAKEKEEISSEATGAEEAPIVSEVVEENTQNSDTSSKKVKKSKGKKKKTSMSFFTAFVLSLNNLLTKKGRTILTSFAGSIGIIGIALIFAVSNGLNGYIRHVQETTLSSYPLTIESETVDISSLMYTILNPAGGDDSSTEGRDENSVYKDPLIAELVDALSKTEVNKNDLASFKEFLDNGLKDENSDVYKAISEVQYKYDLNLTVYTKNPDGEIIKSDTSALLQEMIIDYFVKSGAMSESESSSMFGGSSGGGMFTMGSMGLWQELLADSKNGKPVSPVLESQYDLVYGSWPNEYNEIVLVVDKENELDDLSLYALGLLSKAEIDKIIEYAAKGEAMPPEEKEFSKTFEEICAGTYKVILPSDFYYTHDGKTVIDRSNDSTYLSTLYEGALELKVTGIIRLNENSESGYMSGAIGYTTDLTKYVIEESSKSDVVAIQVANPSFDVISKLPFKSTSETLTDAEKKEAFNSYIDSLSNTQKANLYVEICYLNAYYAMVDDETTPDIDQITALENEAKKTLSQMTTQESAIMFVSMAILGSLTEEEMEGLTSSAKSAYEQENPGMSFDMLPPQMQQMILAQHLSTQYEFNKYSYETLMSFITPLVYEGAKATIRAGVDGKLATDAPETLDKANALLSERDSYTDKSFAFYYDNLMRFSTSSYEENLVKLGKIDMATPSSINIYTATFEQKDDLKDIIDDYNRSVGEGSGKQIKYSDIMGDMMSGITTIINAITYVLIAFVATSLIVSSIMIGVITLISVQERTKEIGVLRAMGASKRDISRVFNAETMIVGLISGLLGILVTLILSVIINIILFALTGIVGLKASLGFWPAVILILVSMGLTLLAGLIPSRVAAKKDPVIALRSE